MTASHNLKFYRFLNLLAGSNWQTWVPLNTSFARPHRNVSLPTIEPFYFPPSNRFVARKLRPLVKPLRPRPVKLFLRDEASGANVTEHQW